VIVVTGLPEMRNALQVESITGKPIYEDDHILILNKPLGSTVTRERNATGCPFRNGVLEYLRQGEISTPIDQDRRDATRMRAGGPMVQSDDRTGRGGGT